MLKETKCRYKSLHLSRSQKVHDEGLHQKGSSKWVMKSEGMSIQITQAQSRDGEW